MAAENSRKVRMSPRACRVRRAQRKKQTGWVSGSRISTSCRASQRKPLWVPFLRSEVSRPPRSGRGQLVLQFSHSDPPAFHERHAGLQVRPERLLCYRCPEKRELSLRATSLRSKCPYAKSGIPEE